MKFSDLQVFVDIVEAGGLTAAANRRGVTQPGLSRVLRDLETRMQAQLLTRTGRGIELTPQGDVFLRFAIDTLEQFEQTRQLITREATSHPRALTLSVPLRLGRLLIPDLYRTFAERLPETAVHIFEEPTARARALLAENQMDAALTYRTSPRPARDFVPIFTEAFFAVGHVDALSHTEGSITMAEVGRLPLLLPNSGPYRDLIQSAFRTAGHPFKIVRALETAEGLLAFAAEGDGVAILPMSNVYQEVERDEVAARQIVDPEITRAIGVHLHPDMSRATASQVLSVIRHTLKAAAPAALWRKRG